jgi:hypothetical protein
MSGTVRKATTTMRTRKSGVEEGQGGDSPCRLIDAKIRELSDWRGETLARVRMLIKQAEPEVVEEWKWKCARRGPPLSFDSRWLDPTVVFEPERLATSAQGEALGFRCPIEATLKGSFTCVARTP